MALFRATFTNEIDNSHLLKLGSLVFQQAVALSASSQSKSVISIADKALISEL